MMALFYHTFFALQQRNKGSVPPRRAAQRKNLSCRIDLRGAGNRIFTLIHHGAYQLYGSAQSQIAGVQAEIITVDAAPTLGRIVLIIRSTALIRLENQALCFLGCQLMVNLFSATNIT